MAMSPFETYYTILVQAQKINCDRCAKAVWCPARKVPGLLRCDLYRPKLN